MGYARVCADVRKCTYMCVSGCGSKWVGAGVCGCVWYAGVCMGMCGSVRKCTGVCKCVHWMNFQNIFWRLESIHQQTLICILNEFFLNNFGKLKGIYHKSIIFIHIVLF